MKNPSQRNEIVGCRGGKAPDIVFASIHMIKDLDSEDSTRTFPILKDRGHMLPTQIECHAPADGSFTPLAPLLRRASRTSSGGGSAKAPVVLR
jgi:hypothetical protein